MFRYRNTDPEKYSSDHPYIHPELPEFLKSACPDLIVFGTDTISISNPQHRDKGKASHRAFLCSEKPVLLAEDLDLSDPALTAFSLAVTLYPWIVDELDGVPVLAFAEFLAGKTPVGLQKKEKRP
jgi:kynurenine formamidase